MIKLQQTSLKSECAARVPCVDILRSAGSTVFEGAGATDIGATDLSPSFAVVLLGSFANEAKLAWNVDDESLSSMFLVSSPPR